MEGEDAVALDHFCPLLRQGSCGDVPIGPPDAGTGCAVDGPNSLHLALQGVCLVPRETP